MKRDDQTGLAFGGNKTRIGVIGSGKIGGTIGDYVMSGWPVRFGGQTPKVGPAQLLGQHGEQVLSEWLSYDATRIEELKREAVVS